MFKIDQRFIKIIDILRMEGLDWLSFEIMESIHNYKYISASEDDNKLARDGVDNIQKGYDFEKISLENDVGFVEINGDEQIKWVIDYISNKFEDVFEDINSIEKNMNELLGGDLEVIIAQDDEEKFIYPKNILDQIDKIKNLKKSLALLFLSSSEGISE